MGQLLIGTKEELGIKGDEVRNVHLSAGLTVTMDMRGDEPVFAFAMHETALRYNINEQSVRQIIMNPQDGMLNDGVVDNEEASKELRKNFTHILEKSANVPIEKIDRTLLKKNIRAIRKEIQ